VTLLRLVVIESIVFATSHCCPMFGLWPRLETGES
jgi:hypothetical protein